MAEDIWIMLRGIRYKRLQELCLINEDETQIMFNGYVFTWDGNYYKGRCNGKGQGFSTLQRYIWFYYNGEIPKRYVIHHKDGNSKNNDISNLECLSTKEHSRKHAVMPNFWPHSQRCKDFLKSQQGKAALWHSSEEGRRWHKEHAKSLPLLQGIRYPKKCVCCGEEYQAKMHWQKYCCEKCKTKDRYNKRLDYEDRNCIICKNLFNVHKRFTKKTCCKECKFKATFNRRRGL